MRAAIVILAFVLVGCATVPPGTVVGSDAWYAQRIQEIDQAFLNKEIDREKQISLKNEADMMRLMYQRDINRQLREQSHVFSYRPVYDCNNGVCSPISP